MTELKGVPYLAARIARLALALDSMVAQLETLDVTEVDALTLESPTQHMRLAVDNIEELLVRANSLDQSGR